jgi:hypothetical protein
VSFENLRFIVYALIAIAVLADLVQIIRFCLPRFLEGTKPGIGWFWLMGKFTSLYKGQRLWVSGPHNGQYEPTDIFPGNRFQLFVGLIFSALVFLLLAIVTFPIRLYHRCRRYPKYPLAVVFLVGIWVVQYYFNMIPRDVKILGVGVFVLLGILYFVGSIIWTLTKWLFSIPKRIYRHFRPLPPPPPIPKPTKPIICKNRRENVTIICTKGACEEAERWHQEGVEKGYRTLDEKIVVPGFIYYDDSVPVGEKAREDSSNSLSWYKEDIEPHCQVQERADIYVPFTSENRRRRSLDRKLFQSPDKTHQHAGFAILNHSVPKHEQVLTPEKAVQ